MGKIYEHQNFLWWTAQYKELSRNDDAVNKITGNYFDFSLIEEFTPYEDYYIAVCGYGSSTGSYNLHIEPNEDKKRNKQGGTWISDKLDAQSLHIGIWTDSKQYLTKEDAILLYIYSNPMTRDTYGALCNTNLDEIADIYNDDPQRALDISLDILGLIPKMPYVASLSLTVLGWIVKTAMQVTSVNDTIFDILYNTAGVVHHTDGRITAERGLLIERTYAGAPSYSYETAYKIFNDTEGEIMTGDQYCKGYWE